MWTIRELERGEIALLKDFAPPEWNSDLSRVFGRHFGQPYFYPIVAELDGSLVGCANGLVQGNTGWLGNIIVRPEMRGQGLGRALTEDLVQCFQAKGLPYQVLVATSMGEPVYRKLGFEITSRYIFFARQAVSPSTAILSVRPMQPADHEDVFAIDRAVTGETRVPFLTRYLEDAWVDVGPSGRVDGYYVPSLGTGLVIADNDEAGLALLSHKVSHGGDVAVVPESNAAAVNFLLSHGFVETSRAPRMALGPDLPWQPEHVYGRGSGFCG